MMKAVTRKFSNEHVIPFVRKNWKAEWNMNPDERLPPRILEVANEIGIRTLGVPEEFGGTPLDPKTETQTFRAGTADSRKSWFRSGKCRCCCATSRRATSRRNGFRRW